MPWLGRQCSTTVSPGFTVVTPRPISITCADASWPSRCGRNLSGPLAAAISLSWAPQIVEYSTLTRTWPTPSVSGSAISSTTSGSRDCARIAAFAVLTCMLKNLFEIDEFVVAGIAEMVIEPDPFRRMQERFRGQRPAFEIELLELVAIALEHDVFVLADPVDLLHRGLELEQAQIVQAAERDHQVKRAVAIRVTVLGAIAKQIRLDLVAGVGEGVFRDVEAGDLEPRQNFLHLVEQERFAAADVEYARSVLEPVDVDQGLRHRLPAPVDELVAAIAVAAVAVPVVELVFLGLHHAMHFVVVHAREVIALRRLVQRGDDVGQGARSSYPHLDACRRDGRQAKPGNVGAIEGRRSATAVDRAAF